MFPLELFAITIITVSLAKFIKVLLRTIFPMSPNWTLYGANSNCWVIVTGASDGIGKEFALQFSKKSFNILLIGRNEEKLKSVTSQMFGNGKKEIMVMDLANLKESDLKRLEEFSRDHQVTILINNAGQSHEHPEYFTECTVDTLNNIIAVNCQSVVNITHRILPLLSKKYRRLVLNVGSMAGEIPIPLLQVYSGSKAFLKNWSIALANEMSPLNVHVEYLNTYFVVTKMSKLKRASWLYATPKDYVASVLKYCGTASFNTPYVSHAIIHAIVSLFPQWLLCYIQKYAMMSIRAVALKKKGINMENEKNK